MASVHADARVVQEQPVVIDRAEGTDLIDSEVGDTSTASPRCGATSTDTGTQIDGAVRGRLERVAHSTLLGLTRAAAELAARLVELAPPG